MLDLSVGAWTLRRTSTIAATEWFVRLIAEKGVSEADFGRHKGQELIVVARTEKDFRRDAEGNYGPHKKSIWVNYRDTEETRAYRREMERLNDFLDQADIEFIPDGLLPKVCPSERTLRRYFSSGESPRKDALQRNGRLFGGFWLNLKKGRRKNIRISGEPVALLDFSSMFVRLAYATVGQEPPQGDLYDLSGVLKGYDNEEHRDGAPPGPPGPTMPSPPCPPIAVLSSPSMAAWPPRPPRTWVSLSVMRRSLALMLHYSRAQERSCRATPRPSTA